MGKEKEIGLRVAERAVSMLRTGCIQLSTSFEPDHFVSFLIPKVSFAPSASQMLSYWRSYPYDLLLLATEPPVQSRVNPRSAISAGFSSSFLAFFPMLFVIPLLPYYSSTYQHVLFTAMALTRLRNMAVLVLSSGFHFFDPRLRSYIRKSFIIFLLLYS